MFEENRFEFLQRQQHCRQLPVSRCLSGCILYSPTRQHQVGQGLFVESEGRVGPGAAQEQHMKAEGGNIMIQETQPSAKRTKSFHTQNAHGGKL